MTLKISKLIQDSLNVTFAKGVTYLTGGLWGVLLARWMGVDFFGAYIFWFGVSSIFATVGEFGFTSFLTKELSSNSESKKQIFCFYGFLQLFLNFLITIFLFALAYYLEKKPELLFVALTTIIIVISDNLFATLSTWFYSELKAVLISKISIVKSLLVLCIGILFHFLGLEYGYILIIPAILSLCRLLFLLYILFHQEKIQAKSFFSISLTFISLYSLLKKTWMYGLLSILATIQAQSDPALLKLLGFGEHQFGIIGVASRIKIILSLSGASFLQVLLPKFVMDYSISREKFAINFLKAYKLIFVLSLLGCSFFFIFSKRIVLTLFGSQYLESIRFLELFSLGTISPIVILVATAIISIDRQDFNLIWAVISYSLLPIFKIFFIPRIGYIFIGWIEAFWPWVGLIITSIFIFKITQIRLGFKNILDILILILLLLFIPIILMKLFLISDFITFFLVVPSAFVFISYSKFTEIKSYVKYERKN